MEQFRYDFSRRDFTKLLLAMGVTAASFGFVGCGKGGGGKNPEGTPTIKDEGDVRTLVDAAGRSVTIPKAADIKKVYCAIPTSQAFVVTLCPEKLVGWVSEVPEGKLKFLPEYLAKLPVLGGWMGAQETANIEAIINAAPDIILYCYGSNDVSDDMTPYADAAQSIQDRCGKPTVVYNGRLSNIPANYRFLGKLLGCEERGEEMAKYCEKKLDAVAKAVAKVPADKVMTCYYAEGKAGLNTDPAQSGHTEVIDFCNVKNIAITDGFAGPNGQGMIGVDMESVLNWNPQIILCGPQNADLPELIKTSESWAKIDAVKNGRVYKAPAIPFGWFDRPPDATRVLGCQWFANLVYPEYYNVDIVADIKEYFKLAYNVDLKDGQLANILKPNPLPESIKDAGQGGGTGTGGGQGKAA